MGLIVDSSVLIGLERLSVSPSRLMQPGDEEVAISAVTVSELYFGLHRAKTTHQRMVRAEFMEFVLAGLPVIAFDLSAATIHARIWADLAAEGQQIGVRDAMIAATALAHSYAVLTDNVREFSRVPGLDVRTPTW